MGAERRGGRGWEPDQLAREVMEAIADRKGSDIVMLDLRAVSVLADFFVIASGTSQRQMRAISDAILERCRAGRSKPLRTEGTAESGWMILDYGNVIVHLFAPSHREYFDLENLWSDASVVVRMQ
ncbi:MAG: ribosome silencing factor [Anaerolineae bacterium]